LSTGCFQSLTLNGNFIRDDGVKMFVNSNKLLTLNVASCGITDTGANIVLKNKILETLNLDDNNITGLGLDELRTNLTLKTLLLTHVPILNVDHLVANNSLRVLCLTRTNVKDELVEKLGRGLKGLVELYLTGNNIGDLATVSLASHTNIKKLALVKNNITSEGAIALFQSDSLKHINLSFNKLDNACKPGLAIARAKHMYVQVDGNPIHQVIAPAFEIQKSLNVSTKSKKRRERKRKLTRFI
jgi:hypothetical protein